MLGMELQIDVEIPLEEVAAHCLWEFTYYGFSDEELEEARMEWIGMGYTHYGKLVHDLEKKYYLGLIYNKRIKKIFAKNPIGMSK